MNKGISLNTRLAMLVGVLLLVIGGTIGSALWVIHGKKADAVVLNLAGRQRMLAQKFAMETLQEANDRKAFSTAEERGRIAAAQITADRQYYTKNIIGKLKKEWPGFKASDSYHDMNATIPLPATFVREVSESLDPATGYEYELLSKWNIRPNSGLRDESHQRAWKSLSADPNRPYTELVPSGDGLQLRYATADVAGVQGCVSCHNGHSDSPKTDFQLNDLMGILVVTLPVTQDKLRAEAIMSAQTQGENLQSDKTRKLFEITQAAVRDGGDTFSDLSMTKPASLPRSTNQKARAKLADVDGLWKQLVQAAQAVRSNPVGSEAYLAALSEVPQYANACLKEAQVTVDLLQADFEAKTAALMTIQCVAGGVSVVVFLIILVYIRNRVCRPLASALQVAEAVAQGDLTQTCPVKSTDEVGQLSLALNEMCANLKQIISKVAGGAADVGNSATQLLETASQLTSGARKTSDQSGTVAAAAEEMSVNMKSMASSTEQMSSNVKTVASAVEEMTASVSEIAKNAEQAASIAEQAASLSKTGNDSIGQLDEAADAIGKVIETIQDIAEQTNLLALNATIEAARAGDAGKGFAVVANEVKELAKQTAEATEDIRRRIEGIQDSTGSAVTSIGQIGDVIGKVNDVSRSIASAVEEQSITTQEIARNIAQTVSAAETVSAGVGQSALAIQEINTNITDMDKAAHQTAEGAARTKTAGSELSELGGQLKSLVGEFKM